LVRKRNSFFHHRSRFVARQPGGEAEKLDLARRELAKGTGIAKTARLVGLGTGTVHKLKRAM
jgi:hypothetical protein